MKIKDVTKRLNELEAYRVNRRCRVEHLLAEIGMKMPAKAPNKEHPTFSDFQHLYKLEVSLRKEYRLIEDRKNFFKAVYHKEGIAKIVVDPGRLSEAQFRPLLPESASRLKKFDIRGDFTTNTPYKVSAGRKGSWTVYTNRWYIRS